MVRVAGLVMMGWMALAPPGAAAQDRAQQDGPSPEARQAYETGLQAMEDGRWADALRAFERSYREFPAAAAMFNQGIVLRSLGRLREARDAFARVMADHPEAPEDVRASADELGREVAGRVAALTVVDLPAPSDELRLRFDGSPLDDDGARPLELEVDPGEHALTVLADGYEPFEWSGRLGDGERGEVRVELEEEGIPLWAWIAAGGGVALGAVIVAVLLATAESDQTAIPMPERGR